MDDGEIQLTMQLNNLAEVERWILSWGEHATVVEPKELVSRVKQVVAVLGERY